MAARAAPQAINGSSVAYGAGAANGGRPQGGLYRDECVGARARAHGPPSRRDALRVVPAVCLARSPGRARPSPPRRAARPINIMADPRVVRGATLSIPVQPQVRPHPAAVLTTTTTRPALSLTLGRLSLALPPLSFPLARSL